MRAAIATIFAVILVLVVGGLGLVYSGIYHVGADQPHWPVTSWLLDKARIRSIRAHAAGLAVPANRDSPAAIQVGVTHFAEHCVVCHAAPGVERGDIAAGLSPRPPNLADVVGFYSPAELFWIIKHGVRMTGMPAWSDHSEDELWATVAFIEKLPGMTDKDYARLIAASRDAHPPGGAARPPGGTDHDHPAGHHH